MLLLPVGKHYVRERPEYRRYAKEWISEGRQRCDGLSSKKKKAFFEKTPSARIKVKERLPCTEARSRSYLSRSLRGGLGKHILWADVGASTP